MGEIEKAHINLEAVVEKVQEALGALSVAGPAIDRIRGHFEAVAGENSNNSHVQQTMSILSQIADGLEEVPRVLDAAVKSVHDFDRDI